HMTLEENVAFGLHSLPRKEARRRVSEQIARVQLGGMEKRRPRQLSGGQQQRAALARALAAEPDVILLDEPLSALDVHLRSQMEALLVETLASFRGPSLYVTHNLEEAYRIAEEIVVISSGQEIAMGPKDAIFRHPPNYATAQVTGCKNFSRARILSAGRVAALDWGCDLLLPEISRQSFEYVGFRAHHISVSGAASETNSFPCKPVRAIEGPFRMTLYLQLLLAEAPPASHHLQAEVTRESWDNLRKCESPWYAVLAPEKLMVF
ncbi:MAG: ATP-binding cassette domain-containing protein, partial [Acidobacteriota bacterium]|nr:ATP-binding cassette domain-containing protein [Acidobacteriota bacterium]